MALGDDLALDFNNFLRDANNITSLARVRYFSLTVGSGYDDQVTLTKSGADVFISGLFMPIDSANKGDNLLLEQGIVRQGDSKFYFAGSINLIPAGSEILVRIGLGSNTGTEFSIVNNGVLKYPNTGSPVYNKAYLTWLPIGSLQGE